MLFTVENHAQFRAAGMRSDNEPFLPQPAARRDGSGRSVVRGGVLTYAAGLAADNVPLRRQVTDLFREYCIERIQPDGVQDFAARVERMPHG